MEGGGVRAQPVLDRRMRKGELSAMEGIDGIMLNVNDEVEDVYSAEARASAQTSQRAEGFGQHRQSRASARTLPHDGSVGPRESKSSTMSRDSGSAPTMTALWTTSQGCLCLPSCSEQHESGTVISSSLKARGRSRQVGEAKTKMGRSLCQLYAQERTKAMMLVERSAANSSSARL